ncbi:hypothetical protein HanRHA438_Chr01g0031681 [Helianthus annuus]|nr:hypothetical protein HanRHA438_Chr01g0031681 [Helianthus annuus]
MLPHLGIVSPCHKCPKVQNPLYNELPIKGTSTHTSSFITNFLTRNEIFSGLLY